MKRRITKKKLFSKVKLKIKGVSVKGTFVPNIGLVLTEGGDAFSEQQKQDGWKPFFETDKKTTDEALKKLI